MVKWVVLAHKQGVPYHLGYHVSLNDVIFEALIVNGGGGVGYERKRIFIGKAPPKRAKIVV